MRGGGANRILIGDPALSLFSKTELSSEQVDVINHDDRRMTVRVRWAPGFHPWAWNIFGERGTQKNRVFARIDISSVAKQLQSGRLNFSSKLVGHEGQQLPHDAKVVAEAYHGKYYLHLQAATSVPNERRRAISAEFEITW